MSFISWELGLKISSTVLLYSYFFVIIFSHLILFLTFRSAIEEGKGIYNNIKNFVRFQLST